MADSPRNQHICDEEMVEPSIPASSPANRKGKKKHISMHEGIGAWADCCSCEAEPYWREHAGEMGVDFNEYEEDEFDPPEPGQETRKEK